MLFLCFYWTKLTGNGDVTFPVHTVLLVGLQVLLENVMSWALLAPVPHNACRAFDDLSGFAFLVDLAKTSPFTKLHVGVNLDKRDSVLHAESSHEFLVHGLITVFCKDAEEGLAFVQSLGCFAETASKSISNECLLQDFLDGTVFECALVGTV